MGRPYRVTLKERELESMAQAHEQLADKLAFPAYYGANLDALEDCLEDIHMPTRIVLRRDLDNPKPWFDDLIAVVKDSAQRSCFLGCSIRD